MRAYTCWRSVSSVAVLLRQRCKSEGAAARSCYYVTASALHCLDSFVATTFSQGFCTRSTPDSSKDDRIVTPEAALRKWWTDLKGVQMPGDGGVEDGTMDKAEVSSSEMHRRQQGLNEDGYSHCVDVSLSVRWYSPSGEIIVNQLLLRPIDGLDSLEEFSKSLVARAFPESEQPAYLTSSEFYKFTPEDEILELPEDVSRTEFRLVATYDGWEYTVLERDLGVHHDPLQRMLVTVIEFESPALMAGQSLISYPVVSVKKTFLDDVALQLRTNPNFKGIRCDVVPYEALESGTDWWSSLFGGSSK